MHRVRTAEDGAQVIHCHRDATTIRDYISGEGVDTRTWKPGADEIQGIGDADDNRLGPIRSFDGTQGRRASRGTERLYGLRINTKPFLNVSLQGRDWGWVWLLSGFG